VANLTSTGWPIVGYKSHTFFAKGPGFKTGSDYVIIVPCIQSAKLSTSGAALPALDMKYDVGDATKAACTDSLPQDSEQHCRVAESLMQYNNFINSVDLSNYVSQGF